MKSRSAICCLAFLSMFAAAALAGPAPKTIAYSAQPNDYFNDHAADVAKLYDGLFFVIGSWDEGVTANLGFPPEAPATTDFLAATRENLQHLREAGATENLLGASFGSSAPWPSAETLLSDEYTAKMARHFGRFAECARELGFRGVSIDVEYPYPRYSLDHEIYTYDGYSANDLLTAAARQGRAVMTAVLDAFPDAVVFELPGAMWSRPIERSFSLAMLSVMAERDAPGGLHQGAEQSYCLRDAASQVGIPREADLAAHALLDNASLDYWNRRCTVAPGVWPLHMVETGAKDYPVRPWNEELAELNQQMRTLRTVAKRYIWSYTGHAIWYPYEPDLAKRYGLPSQEFDGAAEAVPGWHAILQEDAQADDPRILDLVSAVRKFDQGKLGPAELCGRFGTPGDWMILGPFDNPRIRTAFAPNGIPLDRVELDSPAQGRDGVVRWYPFHNYEPTGSVRLRAAMDWRGTHNNTTIIASIVSAKKTTEGYLWFNWDDGATVYLNGQVVTDHHDYPERGHGLQYLDRYNFEEHVPMTIPKGDNLLVVTSINAKGSWGLNLRVADENAFPLKDVSFSLPGE